MLTVIIGLIFMGSFAFYVYKVMFMSNTSFEADYVHLYIKSETTFNQFIEQLNTKQFKEVENFFETMPKLEHIVKVTNPKTGKESKVKLEGLASFFN